jgi:hypothetical protein
MTSSESTRGSVHRMSTDMSRGLKLTIARHARETNVHFDDQLLSARPVDHDARLDVYPAVIDKLDKHRREDDREGYQGH